MLLHPLIQDLDTVATAIQNSRRQFLRPALSIAIYDLELIVHQDRGSPYNSSDDVSTTLESQAYVCE